MKTLLQIDWSEEYIKYIQKNENLNEDLKNDFIKIIKSKDLSERYSLWNKLKIDLAHIKEIKHLANPFYLGFGNPNSYILFMGKEKAFDILNSPELLLHESINNVLQWELLENIEKSEIGVDELLRFTDETEKNVFNPRFPQSYHKDSIKSRNTWGMYANVVNGLIPEKSITTERESELNFFNYCFTTELNYKPSKSSLGNNLSELRKELLQNPFFKKFKYVIVGANAIINEEELNVIFPGEIIKDVNLEGEKDKGKKISIIKTSNQRIILCNQLSGAAGWSKEAIDELIKQIKN